MSNRLDRADIHQRLSGLKGIKHAWVLDTEFQSFDGRPRPVCLCALDLVTGERVQSFFYPEQVYVNPFTYADSILIGFNLAADWSVFISLGWELPPRCIDLSFEFKQQTNGKLTRDLETPFVHPYRRKLIHACEYFGVDHLGFGAKADEQQNIIQNGSFAPIGVLQAEYERRVISYCWVDVAMTAELFWKALRDMHTGQALLRGSYSRAVAWYERNGIPLNERLVRKVLFHRSTVRARLALELEAEYGFGIWRIESNEVTRCTAGLRAYVKRKGWQSIWPRTPGGDYSLSRDRLKDLADQFGEVRQIREFVKSDNLLKNVKLAITDDGWNRVPVLPFTQASGRNTPTGASILTGPKWMRLLLQAPPGYALISVDVVSEENALAAAASGDENEIADYEAGLCPYLSFAIRCGRAPVGMTKELAERTPYESVRKVFKVATLATQYGAKSRTISRRLGISKLNGDILVAALTKARKKYWDWSDAQVAMARKNGYIETIFGWRMWVYPEHKVNGRRVGTKTTTLINWPVQSSGAEILRLASIYLERAGYGEFLGFPHHDAIYATAPVAKAQEVADAIGEAFALAGNVVTDGRIKLRVETDIRPFPEHYREDKDAQVMYDRVMNILTDLPDPTDEQWNDLRLHMAAGVKEKQHRRGQDR
jgi:hypothetical protein